MDIQALISTSIPSLSPEDSVEHALGLLMEHNLRHLPVVDEGGALVGILSEEQLLDSFEPDESVRDLLGRKPVSAQPHDHVFDLTRLMVKHDLTALPVTDDDDQYLGMVRRYDMFDQFARMLSTQEAGAILALEVDPQDYSMAKLIHTVEQNDVKVLSVASEPANSDGGPRLVTIKLNTTDATRVRHMLEHHGYRIVSSFGERDDQLLERVQEFMRYLEV